MGERAILLMVLRGRVVKPVLGFLDVARLDLLEASLLLMPLATSAQEARQYDDEHQVYSHFSISSCIVGEPTSLMSLL
jgi:hypothetical protein